MQRVEPYAVTDEDRLWLSSLSAKCQVALLPIDSLQGPVHGAEVSHQRARVVVRGRREVTTGDQRQHWKLPS